MESIDLTTFGGKLNALAEVYDRKALSAASVKIWFDTLKEFPFQRIAGTLDYWPKLHGKMPAPAEVWKALNEVGIDDRERQAALDKKLHERIDWSGPTARGNAALREIAEILKRPKRTPVEHWRHVLADETAPPIAKEYATVALAQLQRRHTAERERQPGEDDEEIAA